MRVLTSLCDYTYMDISSALLSSFVSFGRTFLGIIIKPYETYRRIVDRGRLGELLWIGLLLVIYFGNASIVKTAAFRPFLLTKQFIVLAGGAGVSFLLIVCTLWQITRFLGGKGNFRSFTLAWGYTLVPTFFWFLGTSLLYVILPPPRTNRPEGVLFSALYLVLSATLFFWKFMLGYLTLRFGAKLDLPKILITLGIALPIIGIYSVCMYKLGIFRVPFL